MPFQIQPVREFLVRPAIPPALSRMSELAYNILWSWEPSIRALFRRLDPALWKESGYNPVAMLARVALKSAGDLDLPLIGVGLLYQQGYFRQFLNADGWQQERYGDNGFYTLPIQPVRGSLGHDLRVTVTLPTGPVTVQVCAWMWAA